MIQTLLYAKKVLLPSTAASAGQSLQMASAFGKVGAKVFFYPGVSDNPDNIFASYGLREPDTRAWSPLHVSHKGLYGALFRARVFVRAAMGVDAIIARDISEALFVASMRQFMPKSIFSFEMHEALFLMHTSQPGKNWKKTLEQERKILTQVDSIIVVNENIAITARKELGYNGPVLVEPYGFNPEILSQLPLFDAEHRWPDADAPVKIVYIGSLREGKGVQELIQAMQFLPERFSLKIIGSGSKEICKITETLCASIPNSTKRICLTGHVAQKDLRAACSGSHISVIPQQGGIDYFSPIKFNESLALGLPLVITPLAVFNERKHLAHSAADCSPQSLAKAIAEIAANPDRALHLRTEGLRVVKENTWEARAQRILDFAQQTRRPSL